MSLASQRIAGTDPHSPLPVARSIAPLQRNPSVTGASREYLTFRIGAEEYAIDILRVQEIRGHSTITRIAHAPPSVKGVVNLRGVIVPVVDLRLCLQAHAPTRDEDTVTIVLDLGERVVGTVVDAVSDVLSLDASDIRPAPEVGRSATSGSILGIACPGDASGDHRMLVVLDIERLLTDADIGL
jgi:purine-binding chemotaxis protein CheW